VSLSALQAASKASLIAAIASGSNAPGCMNELIGNVAPFVSFRRKRNPQPSAPDGLFTNLTPYAQPISVASQFGQ
jgi:hypothetical protein